MMTTTQIRKLLKLVENLPADSEPHYFICRLSRQERWIVGIHIPEASNAKTGKVTGVREQVIFRDPDDPTQSYRKIRLEKWQRSEMLLWQWGEPANSRPKFDVSGGRGIG